ncbi:MAG TPA: MBL fold metallo-hydrolase [Blastocatellia bacterium]|jgi:Predicted Zn-dependent hydrolases of the beta-lactamase fold
MSRLIFQRLWLAPLLLCTASGAWAQTSARMPCETLPQYKQFDFWIGEWEVTAEGRKVADSSIQRIVNGCVIYENYTQPDGYLGKSFNFFDAHLGKWRQTWVDAGGNTSEFTGEYKDGAMRYDGETHRQSGAKVLRRMIVYDLGPDRVRQYSERSTDGGKTWGVAYDFIYVRKNGRPTDATLQSGAHENHLEITYLANEGFLISGAGKKILLDALFREGVKGYAAPSAPAREKLEKAAAPFDSVDLALATHYHADHFDPMAVSRYLLSNPQALFVSTPQAVEKLKAAEPQFASLKSRVIAAAPKEGERVRIAHRGIAAQALNVHHGRNRPIENLGFLVEIGGRKLLHIGDAEATDADLATYELPKEAIDIAFVPYWYFLSDGLKKAVSGQLRPRHIVVMHIPPLNEEDDWIKQRGGWTKALNGIRADFPNAVIFEREMESKKFK